MQIQDRKILTALGLMSGTSMDGIDLAMIRSDGESELQILASDEYSYDSTFRKQIETALEEAREIEDSQSRSPFLKGVETEITRHHCAAVQAFLKKQGMRGGDIDLLGFHGQTVLHRPQNGFTVQLGDGQKLADETGIATVFDMRSNDMRHGGQGAPLIPVYHQALASRLQKPFAGKLPVAFVNIGGISNISYIGKNGDLIAFDTGPGNALLDQWVQAHAGIPFDQGGSIASEGSVLKGVVEQYLAESFFEETVPKSLDRNDFRPLEPSEASLEDGARTLANLSAQAIIMACSHLPEAPKLWIVSGGGRKHPAIMSDLAELAAQKGGEVVMAEKAGLNGDSMEAEAWAYLAIRSIKQLPLTFPKTTGCTHAVTGGRLAWPVIRQEN